MIYKPNLWLCFTSATFFATSYYGHRKQNFLHQLDTLHAISSLIYWSDPSNGFKRAADVFISNVAGASFAIYGYRFIRSRFKTFAYINGFFMLSSFGVSYIMYSYNNPYWICAHMSFHLFVVVNKMLTYNCDI